MKQTQKATRMSDQAVEAKTGKIWSEWFKILDKAGAKKMNHQEIVSYLSTNHDVGPWWQQMVTVAYEQARGRREKHQTPAGYQISVSRTVAVPISTLYEAWQNKKKRGQWLPKVDFTVRKATENKSMRITWVDGKTNLEVNFYGRGKDKGQVVVQHNKLCNADEAAKQKSYWAKALDRLISHLTTH